MSHGSPDGSPGYCLLFYLQLDLTEGGIALRWFKIITVTVAELGLGGSSAEQPLRECPNWRY
ncbi:hypothetical protein GCM10027511_03320 [Hymenobacter humi]